MKFKDVVSKRHFLRETVLPALYKTKNADCIKVAKKMYDCSDYFKYALCTHDFVNHYKGSSCCKQRICPICAKKRSMLYHIKFIPIVRQLLNKGYYLNGLNFTITNTDNLSKCLEVLNKAYRLLSHDDKMLASEFKKRFCGGIRTIEIKIGKNSKLWHAHIHCIVVKKFYSEDYEWLKTAWNLAVKLAGGEESKKEENLYGLISIFSIKDKKNLNSDKLKSVEIGVIETIKYITKFEFEMNVDLLPELVKSIKRVRMINTWGVLRNVDLDVEKDMDKDFTEIKECCCSICGGTDFIEFSSRRIFRNTQDFDLENAPTVKQKKLPAKAYGLLRTDLIIGKKYGDCVCSEKHKALIEINKYIPLLKVKNQYRFAVAKMDTVFINKGRTEKIFGKIEEVYESEKIQSVETISFSPEMFKEITKTLPEEIISNEEYLAIKTANDILNGKLERLKVISR